MAGFPSRTGGFDPTGTGRAQAGARPGVAAAAENPGRGALNRAFFTKMEGTFHDPNGSYGHTLETVMATQSIE